MKRVFTISYRLSQYKRLIKRRKQIFVKGCITSENQEVQNVEAQGALVDDLGEGQMKNQERKENPINIKEDTKTDIKINLEECQLQQYLGKPRIIRMVADSLINKRFKSNSNAEELDAASVEKNKACEISTDENKPELLKIGKSSCTIESNENYSKSQSNICLYSENHNSLELPRKADDLQTNSQIDDLNNNLPAECLQYSSVEKNRAESSFVIENCNDAKNAISVEDKFFEAPNSFADNAHIKTQINTQNETNHKVDLIDPKIYNRLNNAETMPRINNELTEKNNGICRDMNLASNSIDVKSLSNYSIDNENLLNDLEISKHPAYGLGRIEHYSFASLNLTETKILKQDLGFLNFSVKLLEEALEASKNAASDYLKKVYKDFTEEHAKEQENKITLVKKSLSESILDYSSKIRSLTDSIEIDGILKLVEQLRNAKSESMFGLEEELRNKENTVNSLNEAKESLKIRAAIQEEQIDYLSKVNDVYRIKDTKTTELVNVLQENCPNLFKKMALVEKAITALKEAFSDRESYNSKTSSKFQLELNSIKTKIDAVRQMLDLDDILISAKSSLQKYFDSMIQSYSFQVETLQKSNIDLETRAKELNYEIGDLKSKNASLLETNKFISEEIELKGQYSREMENTVDEMMRSNKFYEDQLLKSDELLRMLKEKQLKMSLDYARQVEKMRMEFLKENGILKLKIEELELEIGK